MSRSKISARIGGGAGRSSQLTDIGPALTALLDHIAEDLAREYVRLMERAASDGGANARPDTTQKEA